MTYRADRRRNPAPIHTGDEIPVCNCLFPMPFGTWRGDLLSMGTPLVAPYVIPDTQICCSEESLNLIDMGGKLVSSTRIWHDHWTPPHPKNGSTRCAVATMMDSARLAEAEARLGRKLAWSARLKIWDREKEYGDYAETELTHFLIE